MRRVPAAGVVLALALMLVASASASVRRGAFTATVAPGDDARLTVKVSPRARCTIRVEYDTVVSRARGLGAKTGTTITWRWMVASSTHAGRWPITVRCGKSGTLGTFVDVRDDAVERGPDVEDVARWQERAIRVVDARKGSPGPL